MECSISGNCGQGNAQPGFEVFLLMTQTTSARMPPLYRALQRLKRRLANERDLRMVWKIVSRGSCSWLVGTAHFFPYRFHSDLREYIARADTVVLEGPLDETARRKVVAAGSSRRGASLYDALDAQTIRRIEDALAHPVSSRSATHLHWTMLRDSTQSALSEEVRQLEPWMAFFHIWTEYRRRDGWIYSVDLEATRIASDMNKKVHFLETIEEQIETLNRVPLERMVNFLGNVDWEDYRQGYVRHYLDGNLAALAAMAQAFPTYCEPVIEARDPILSERMMPFLERGNAIVFVGIMHCRGVIRLMRAWGCQVTGPAVS